MDRGAWRATVHSVADSDTAETTVRVHARRAVSERGGCKHLVLYF